MPAIHHAIFGLTRNPLPIIVTLPVIAGVARVGELLSVSTGSWFGKPTSFTYVWYRGIQSIATGATYTPTTSDISARLTVRVTATNEFGSTTVETLPTADVVSPASAPTGDVILLENNDRLLQENSSFILLEQQATTTGNSLLLESGDEILLESGARLLLDQVEAPTDAYLDVSASYLLDVSGDYIREVP